MSLRFTQVAITLTVEVPEASLERHLAASPRVVGEQLADQVIAYEKTHQLGYFPAIDFFIDNGNIEQALVEALHNIAWVVTGMVRNEVRIKLRPAFSQLKFETLQAQAFTLPPIRPNQQNALAKLIEHFSATTVKISLIATLIQRIDDQDAAKRMAKSMIYKWLKDDFAKVEVTSTHVLS